ncbi:MAG: elongation factor P [Acidobacteria bacterium]|nr:elongation factor P [Acidobacteriota bacterium]MBE3126004.1 elongation factor P [Acidobacteriota bacterium]MBE3131434.1 elongation factor P [Acidobacteriota bacterium]
MIDATQIRKGMIIVMDGTLFRVMEMQLITPGRWKAMVQTKLRNIQVGSQIEHRFRSEERLEQAHLDEVEMEFLYQQGDEYFFMNLENYEQVTLTIEVIGDSVKYLKPNTVIEVELFAGNPVGVNLPKSMDLKVVSTEPRLQGATKTSLYKPAVLETGAVVQVPEFIKEGDVIRVDTRDDTYLERAKTK